MIPEELYQRVSKENRIIKKRDQIMKNAKARGLEFSLTLKTVEKLLDQ